tara:strand:+ start:540 stop:1190 length:651 start_codon:yes stop_codon:yes gene_type:complete
MRFKTDNVASFDEMYGNYMAALTEADREIEENSLTVAHQKPATPRGVFQNAEMSENGMMILSEITDLHLNQITDLYGYYTAWEIYLEHQSVDHKLRKEAAVRAKRGLEWALKIYFVDEQGVKVTQADSHVKTTAAWIAADRQEFVRHATSLKSQAALKSAKSMIEHVSRAQSAKTDSLRNQDRDNSMGRSGGKRGYAQNTQNRGFQSRRRPTHDDF